MTTEYSNENRGVLFKNDRKTKDSQPGYTGSLNVDGVEFFLDAWLKDGKSGKFFSVSVKRKDKQPEAQQPAAPQRQQAAPAKSGFEDFEDDIPFVSSCMSCDMTTSKQRRMQRYSY